MPSGYYRYPTIHEERVVFVCEDDLWEVPAGGGVARRLTSNLGEVTRPSLSLDGQHLAFIGKEEGQPEVYLMPARGGPARRMTYQGAAICRTQGWTPEGKIIYASIAEQWHPGYMELYTLALDGSSPEKLPYGPARSIAYGPNGGIVLGRNTDEPARWKRYKGGTTGQIFLDAQGSGEFRPLIQFKGNLTSPIWIGERIYFIADSEGVGNLYSCLPSGEDLQRHTDHEHYYARNAASDGKRIVYHAGGDIYLFDPATGEDRLVEIEFHSPRVQRNRRFVDPARYLNDWTLHPHGQATAIASRGKIFSFANWEGAVSQYFAQPEEAVEAGVPMTSVRYRLPTYLHDGKRLIAVTDLGGEESFVIWNTDGSGEPTVLEGLDIGRPEVIAANPHKNQIAFSNHRYELIVLDLDTRDLRQIDRGKAYPIAGFDWSPDGEWIAYSVSTSVTVIALKLWNAESNESTLVVEPLIRDVAPSFDPTGRYLYFLSYRTFSPVYDNILFDLSFPRGMKPYLVTLQNDLPSPFIPRPRLDVETCDEDEDEDEGEAEANKDSEDILEAAEGEAEKDESKAGDDKKGEDADKKEPEHKVQIDLEGIQQRIVAFPVPEGIYGRVLGARHGKVLYTRFPIEGAIQQLTDRDNTARGMLLSYSFEDQKEDILINGIADFILSLDHSTMMYRAENRLRVLRAGEKPGDENGQANRRTGWLNLNRVKISVNPAAEWRQMFREAWRLQRDQFWDPDMSAIDWVEVYHRYLPLVDRVSSRSEFSDLIMEMQGELGTSHAYELGGDYRPDPPYTLGYLGAEYTYDEEKGGWRITRILQGDPWESRGDSPLNEPGVGIKVGDVMTAINGRTLTRSFSPGQALVNQAGEEVSLTYKSAEDEERGTCSATVRTLNNEVPIYYREWVEKNRRLVHEATNGEIGYLHIPDMGPNGFAEFHRGFLAELDRPGLIVDVRFNRGGHVSALLLEKLARKRLGYDTARWGEIPTPYPQESVLGPVVALTNEYAGSDGDIFSHGFKMMKIGPLIGMRTWGGVIGIWPRHSLVDGTLTTQPEFSFWFQDVGWGIENYGTDPDIEVDNLPQDYVQGIDRQLQRGIEEVQRRLAEAPPQIPTFDNRPSKALPRIPKR